MSTDQVLFGVGLIVVLALGSQVLASRLRIPALIILLPAGFTAGALTTDVNRSICWGRRSSHWSRSRWR
jgi:NhaP-type Na+/H+ or K+/H+ antiporter